MIGFLAYVYEETRLEWYPGDYHNNRERKVHRLIASNVAG